MRVADIDETALAGESAEDLVARLAAAKAEAVRAALAGPATGACVLLGADTIVAHGARILGKPADREAFLDGLLALSGSWHRVVTAVTVLGCDACAELGSRADVKVVTRVRFGPVDRAAALAYWASGEPVDKAGGYALQGLGARFVERIEGSPSNVVGLPLHEVARLLDAAGVQSSYPPGIAG